MKNADFLCLSKKIEFQQRCQELSVVYSCSFSTYQSVDEFAEATKEGKEPLFIFLSAEDVNNEAEVAGRVQVARQLATQAFILVVISSKLPPQVASFVKKSGANAVLTEFEILNSSRLEFISSQRIKSHHYPIKSQEIRKGIPIPFSVFHVMPLNRKFISVVKKDEILTEEKVKKILEVEEVYIKREDIDKYREYLASKNDASAEGLSRRCRAQFLSLYTSFVDLVLMISDQSEAGSFRLGLELYQRCERLAEELLSTLGATGHTWSIINNSSIGDTATLQRAPAVAAYAGLLSLSSGIGKPAEVMIACMLSDLGMLEISPQVSRKIREGGGSEEFYLSWHPEDQREYFAHPVKSLNLALSRRLPLPDSVKEMILCSHERIDQKGFPQKILPEKIPFEAMILQLAEMLDQKSQVRLGKEKVPIQSVKKQLFEAHINKSGNFSRLFLEKIRGSLMDI